MSGTVCLVVATTIGTCVAPSATWYSGWYNGLARKHMPNVARAKAAEHEVIVYCKGHPGEKIIEAIAVVFKDMRAKLGIKMKP